MPCLCSWRETCEVCRPLNRRELELVESLKQIIALAPNAGTVKGNAKAIKNIAENAIRKATRRD